MVVTHFDPVGVAIFKSKADPPLIVYGNRVLPLPVSEEWMQAITGRHFQVVQLFRQMHVFKFSGRSRSNIGGKLSALALGVELLRSFISEGLDHAANVTVSRDACQRSVV